MAKCTQCGANAGLMMSLCDECIKAGEAERKRRVAEGLPVTAESSGVRPISQPAAAAPISTDALSFLTFVGWAVAVISVIAGIVTLMNTPESGYLRDTTGLRTIYLAIGWSQIIGGIITGVFLNVVADIGRAVLDLWKAQHRK